MLTISLPYSICRHPCWSRCFRPVRPGFITQLTAVTARAVIENYFEGCIGALHEADWMASHSLYALQCVSVMISVANILGKADLYYTMLGAATRCVRDRRHYCSYGVG